LHTSPRKTFLQQKKKGKPRPMSDEGERKNKKKKKNLSKDILGRTRNTFRSLTALRRGEGVYGACKKNQGNLEGASALRLPSKITLKKGKALAQVLKKKKKKGKLRPAITWKGRKQRVHEGPGKEELTIAHRKKGWNGVSRNHGGEAAPSR